MKLETLENSKNYVCSVIQIGKIMDIEGADNIKRTIVNGNNIVIPKSIQEGDTMLYFVSGTKLNADYCHRNNLYDKSEENLNTELKGFISYKQKRVKAIKLRGSISDGMLMNLESLSSFADISSLKIGDEFTTIDGTVICEKYIVAAPVSKNSQSKGKQPVKISRLVDNQFYLHNDTDNLRKNIHKIHPDDIIGIHYKKHGTSVVIGNVLVKKQLTFKDRIFKFFGAKLQQENYDIIYSSRKVIKNGYLNPTQGEGYYGEDIWGVVAKEVGHLIPKSWTLYGEILGYTPSGSGIQGKYDYGCKVGEHKFYVYKISVVNSDGQVNYLSDLQIKEWCDKVGLNYSDTLIYYGKAINHFDYESAGSEDLEEWRNQFLSHLEILYNEKDCYMCSNKVPEEGIILRKESFETYEAYKLKSRRFLLHESEEQEKEISNIEDNQNE